MVYLFIALIVLIIPRYYLSYLLNRETAMTTGDAIFHLTIVKEFYRTGGKPIDMSCLYILDESESDYPYGFHKLFYLLGIPVSWLERNGGYLPIISDALLLLLTYFAMNIFGGGHYEWLLLFPFISLLWDNNGRAAHFSERAFGVLWGNIYLFSAVAYVTTTELYFVLMAVVSFTVFSISSKFAWQATLFISLLISAFNFTIDFVVIYLGCFLASIFITQGYSLKVLKGLIRHSYFYQSYLSQRYLSLKSSYGDLLKFNNWSSYIYMLSNNSILKVLYGIPFLLVMLISPSTIEAYPLGMFWLVASVFLVFLTATEALKFLGEPERYLEFGIIPAFLLISFISVSSLNILIIIIVCLASLLPLLTKIYTHWKVPQSTSKYQKDLSSLGIWFDAIEGKRCVAIDFRLAFFLGYQNNKNKFLTFFSNIGKGERGVEYKNILKDFFPFISNDLAPIIKKYKIDLIFVARGSVNNLHSQVGTYYDFSNFELVYSSDSFFVFKVRYKGE